MVTRIDDVQDQVQKYWAPIVGQELRQANLWSAMLNKEYEGSIEKEGDSVRVTEIQDAVADLRTIGVDADVFDSQAIVKSYIDIKVDKRLTASFEFQDLVEIQSQISGEKAPIREALMRGLEVKLNTYIQSLVSPSTSAPDHLLTGTSALDATALLSIRKLIGQAKWPADGQWMGMVDPSYYSDLLAAVTLTSNEYAPGEAPVIGGRIANRRFGINLFEDNSLATDVAYFFHPNFMHLVMQQQPRFKISDLHSQKKFGYVISVDSLVGVKPGINHSKMVIKVTA